MNIHCYFCKSNLDYNVGQIHFYCVKCADDNHLMSVITTMDRNVIQYAHIYIKQDFKIAYHIRLLLWDNQTYIGASNDTSSKGITIVPGFPINPTNVYKKLKTYLTLL